MESGALIETTAFSPYPALVPLDHEVGNEQPQARAPWFFPVLSDAVKHAEDFFQVFSRQPFSLVGKDQMTPVPIGFQADLQLRRTICIEDGVFQQVTVDDFE